MKFLTKKEVADVLRVSVRTITDYNSRGLLPKPKRLGRILLWDEDEVLQTVSFAGADRKTTDTTVTAKQGRPRKVRLS